MFEQSERTKKLQAQLLAFMDEHIYPNEERYFREVSELVAAKRAGERTAIEPELLAEWRPKVEGVLGRLEAALERSVLPEEPRRAGEAALEAWLLAVRKSRFS